MSTLEHITTKLRQKGFRITKARRAILSFLLDQHCALSAHDLKTLLAQEGLKPDQSTIYRELQFLADQGIASEVVFKDGIMRFELKDEHHHHHLVCTGCDTVEAVEIGKHLEGVTQSIKKTKRFQVTSHSLEFYGTCADCH